jgi:hypothetical protein
MAATIIRTPFGTCPAPKILTPSSCEARLGRYQLVTTARVR